MKEYIEREAALKITDDLKDDDDSRFYDVALSDVRTELMTLPTADVEPVRHGKWIKITKPQKSNEGFFYWNAIPKTIYFCSYCGRRESIKEPYCHCGAKMDKEEINNG